MYLGIFTWALSFWWYICVEANTIFSNIIYLSFSDSPLPVSSRVCFVKFHDPDSAVVAQHLTNTVFVDRALIVVPYAEGLCFVSLPMWAPLPGHRPQCRCRVSITSLLDSEHSFETLDILHSIILTWRFFSYSKT